MANPRMIGLVGHAGAGKDTAALGMMAHGYTNVKFSAPLKAMLERFLSLQGADHQTIHRMIEGDLKEVPSKYLAGKTPRHAMQTLGNEWGRQLLGTHLWVDAAMNQAAHFPLVVFSDVRYPNEGDAVRAAGGVLIRITRPGLEVDLSHDSERYAATMTPDYEVENEHKTAAQFRSDFAEIALALNHV